MINENNCQNRREEIAALVLGELEPKAADELRRHIESCETCKSLYRKLTDEEETIRSAFQTIADKGEVLKNRLIEQLGKKESVTSQTEKESAKIIGIHWGNIIKSPITKIAAAAVIILAIALLFHNDSLNIASPVFGIDDVIQAMQKVEWMRYTSKVLDYTSLDPNTIEEKYEGGEYWESVNPNRTITITSSGRIWFHEQNMGKLWTYDPEINTITLTYNETDDQKLSKNLQDLYLKPISELEKQGAKVEYSTGTYNRQPIQIIRIDEETKDGWHNKISVFVDTGTRLAQKVTTYTKNTEGQSVTISTDIDYPKTGPIDIYQAGAPRDAKVVVIDLHDKPELIEALKPYNTARENLLSDYMLVTTRKSGSLVTGIEITYNQGKKQRTERPSVRIPIISGEDDLIAYEKALGDSIESLLKWTQDDEGRTLDIFIYDGQYYYYAQRDSSGKWTVREKSFRPDRNPIPLEDLSELGWPEIPPKSWVRQIENDYSRENNLIAFESTSGSDIRSGKIYFTAQKTINYLDPGHDYMCVRREMFHHPLSGGLGETKIEDVDFDPNEIPAEPGHVVFVSEFGQTDSGRWYPKKIEQYSKSQNPDVNEKPLNLSTVLTLYLKTNPEFPAGIFDPNNLPKN
jgi:hypothetical protein